MEKEKSQRRQGPGPNKTEIGGEKINERVADYDAEGSDTLLDDDEKEKTKNGD